MATQEIQAVLVEIVPAETCPSPKSHWQGTTNMEAMNNPADVLRTGQRQCQAVRVWLLVRRAPLQVPPRNTLPTVRPYVLLIVYAARRSYRWCSPPTCGI